MTLTATTATNFTIAAMTVQDALTLQREVDLAERTIRSAAGRQQFNAVFSAANVGNPVGIEDAQLTALQTAFRDTFIDAGYLVQLDPDTGFWRFSWSMVDVHTIVSVYSTMTTLTPGAIQNDTIELIDGFFQNLIPSSTPGTVFVDQGPGGDIDEADFGGTPGVAYSYLTVVRQQNTSDDHSAALRTTLTGSALGYTNSPSNVFVYKLT